MRKVKIANLEIVRKNDRIFQRNPETKKKKDNGLPKYNRTSPPKKERLGREGEIKSCF